MLAQQDTTDTNALGHTEPNARSELSQASDPPDPLAGLAGL